MSLPPPDGPVQHPAQTRPGVIYQDSPMVVRRADRYQVLEIAVVPDAYPVSAEPDDSRSS